MTIKQNQIMSNEHLIDTQLMQIIYVINDNDNDKFDNDNDNDKFDNDNDNFVIVM